MKREINPVNNNEEKRNTYRVLKGKLSRALKEGFYLEAMLIDYALMEDRLRSYLYYMGLLTDRTKSQANKNIKTDIVSVLEKHIREKEDTNLQINSISGKMKIVRCVAEWSANDSHKYETGYLVALNKSFENIDIDYLLDLFGKIDEWRKYRNEVIHSLMNKN